MDMKPERLEDLKRAVIAGHELTESMMTPDKSPITCAVTLGHAAGELAGVINISEARTQDELEIYLSVLCAAFADAVKVDGVDYVLQWRRACSRCVGTGRVSGVACSKCNRVPLG